MKEIVPLNGASPASAAAGPVTAQPPGRCDIPERPGARWLARFPAAVPAGWRMPLAAYLICQALLLVWWLAFWPGLLTYDSVTYVLHVTTGPWVANHSVLYDSLVWLSLHTTGGLAALTLAQTAAMSAALAYAVAAFRRIGIRGRWTALAAVAVAALPPLASFTIYVWKDVPFAICGFLVAPTLAQLLSLPRDAGRPAGRRATILVVALGLELLGMCLFRLNGFLVAGTAGVLLAVLLPGLRLRVAAAAAGAIGLALALNWGIFPAAGIQRPAAYLTYGSAYGDIAVAYAQEPATFTQADKRLMAEVIPLHSWQKSATCYDTDPTVHSPGFEANAQKVAGQLLALWERVLLRSPGTVLSARICRGSIAWNIVPGPRRLDAYTITYPIPRSPGVYERGRLQGNPYRHALRMQPLSSTARSLTSRLWRSSLAPGLDWLLWRGALWCYLSYLAVLLLARARLDRRLLSLAAVAAAQQLAIIAENHTQSYRYMVGVIPIGMILAPGLFARKRKSPA